MVLCFEVPLGLARLNRTSVGLKLVVILNSKKVIPRLNRTSVGLKHDNIKLRTQKS